ncbi:MAG: translation initiation factor IF-2 subunit beta [Aigarchaeota archaeon]|nr:translation initiation factor IF-2 subunit beta [Candidatus Calditenuis fumarioli]
MTELSGREAYVALLDRLYSQLKGRAAGGGEREIALRPTLLQDHRRTVITNFKQLADALGRDPEHLARFIFKETGKPGTLEGERLVINGKIGEQELGKLLQLYYKEFVKCPVCGGIDTQIVAEKRFRFLVCEACGARTPVRKI